MIKRRILRRLALRNIDGLAEYSERLENDSDELMALQRDLLIGVTSFFRDPECVRMLEESRLPPHSPGPARERDDSRLGGGLRHGRRGILDCHIVAGIPERNGRRLSGADLRFRYQPGGN